MSARLCEIASDIAQARKRIPIRQERGVVFEEDP